MKVTIQSADFNAMLDDYRAQGIRIVLPGDPLRAVIVDVLMVGKAVDLIGWSRSTIADDLSITIPALPQPLPALLNIAGVALAPYSALGAAGVRALADLADRPTISLAPSVMDPNVGAWVATHERQHVLQLAADGFGGIVHAAKYVAHPEHRCLAGEGPAYAVDLARAAWVDGRDPEDVAPVLAEGLRAYGATDALVADTRAQLLVHARTINEGFCPPVRAMVDTVRFLTARGVKGLPALP